MLKFYKIKNAVESSIIIKINFKHLNRQIYMKKI
jgi:hypothetical protein